MSYGSLLTVGNRPSRRIEPIVEPFVEPVRVNEWSQLETKSFRCYASSCCGCLAMLLPLVLLLMSLSSVPYYQIALKQNRFSKTWNYEQTIDTSFYAHSPAYKLVFFGRSQQCSGFLESEGDPVVFYAEQGLPFRLNLYWCWTLIPGELGSTCERVWKYLQGSDYQGRNFDHSSSGRRFLLHRLCTQARSGDSGYYVSLEQKPRPLPCHDQPWEGCSGTDSFP